MGNFAENLNLGNRVRPPLAQTTVSTGATPTGPTLDPLNILIDNFSIA